MDKEIEKLERLARQGDKQAIKRLDRYKTRIGLSEEDMWPDYNVAKLKEESPGNILANQADRFNKKYGEGGVEAFTQESHYDDSNTTVFLFLKNKNRKDFICSIKHDTKPWPCSYKSVVSGWRECADLEALKSELRVLLKTKEVRDIFHGLLIH